MLKQELNATLEDEAAQERTNKALTAEVPPCSARSWAREIGVWMDARGLRCGKPAQMSRSHGMHRNKCPTRYRSSGGGLRVAHPVVLPEVETLEAENHRLASANLGESRWGNGEADAE